MQLDYQINHVLNNYKDDDGCCHYDYVESEIWVKSQDLCYLLRNELDINITPQTVFKTTWEIAHEAWRILTEKQFMPGLIGTYGNKFLNEWKYGNENRSW